MKHTSLKLEPRSGQCCIIVFVASCVLKKGETYPTFVPEKITFKDGLELCFKVLE